MKSIFKTFLVVTICLVCLSNSVQAQTAFEVPVGGIAITGYDFNQNTFSFVCLTEIPAQTMVQFTDKGWFSYTNRFITGESIHYWNTPNGCSLGQVISITSDLNLDPAGDQIFVYQEIDGGTHLIFGLNTDPNSWLPHLQVPYSNQSNLPDTLAGDPLAAISIIHTIPGEENKYGYYHGVRSFNTTSEALAAIVDPTNWTTSDNPLQIPTGFFSFETTAVHLSEFGATTGSETPPVWVLLGLVIVPVAILLFKLPKRDCCS